MSHLDLRLVSMESRGESLGLLGGARMAECPQYEADRISGQNRNGISEEQSLITAQLRVAANAIPAHVWYATPLGVLLSSSIHELLTIWDCRRIIRFVTGSMSAERGILTLSFCIRTIMKKRAESGLTCLRTGGPGEVAFRGRNADREYKRLLSRAEPVRAANGPVLF